MTKALRIHGLRPALRIIAIAAAVTACDPVAHHSLTLAPAPPHQRDLDFALVAVLVESVSEAYGLKDVTPPDSLFTRRQWEGGFLHVSLSRTPADSVRLEVFELPSSISGFSNEGRVFVDALSDSVTTRFGTRLSTRLDSIPSWQ